MDPTKASKFSTTKKLRNEDVLALLGPMKKIFE